MPSLSMPSLPMMPSLQAPSPRKRRQCGPETPRKTRSESPAAANSTDAFADPNNAAPRFFRFIQDPAAEASETPADGAASASADLNHAVPKSGREGEGGNPPTELATIFCNDWPAYRQAETPRTFSTTAQRGAITAAQCGGSTVTGPVTERSPRPPRRRETRQPPLTPRAATLPWGMRSPPAPAEADPADESAVLPPRLTFSPVSSASPACSAFPASPKLLVLPDSAFFRSPRIPEARFASPRTPAPLEPLQSTAPRPPVFRSAASPRACDTAPTTPTCPPLVEPRLPRARTCVVPADSDESALAASADASAIRRASSASCYSPASACAANVAVDRVDPVNGHVSTCEWAEAAGVDTLDIPPWVREKLSASRAEEAQKNESAALTRLSRIDRETMADGEKRAGRVECDGECGKVCSGERAESRIRDRGAEGEKPSLWDIMQWESDMIASACSTAAAKSPRQPFIKRYRSASALPTTPPPTPSASKASLTVQICDDASANGGDLSFFEELLLEFGAGEGEEAGGEAGGEMEEERGWEEEMCIPAEEKAQFEEVPPVVPEVDDKCGSYSVKMENNGKADGGEGLMNNAECIFERIQEMEDEGAEMGRERARMAEDGAEMAADEGGTPHDEGEMADEGGWMADEAEIQTNKLSHDQPAAVSDLLSSVQLERKHGEVGEAEAEQQNAPQYGSPFRSAHGSPSAPAGGFAQMWSEAWADVADAEIPGLTGNCMFRP
ncbi:unnamed protein product [Closterium sp. Yama58-4]|nr:unnamed protein product [Closterium sp. Yama58-4]